MFPLNVPRLFVLFALLLVAASAQEYEWRCSTDTTSHSDSFECVVSCSCEDGFLRAETGTAYCYTVDTTTTPGTPIYTFAEEQFCTSNSQPSPVDSPCEPADGACPWTCTSPSGGTPGLCSDDTQWTTCNCETGSAVSSTTSACRVGVNGTFNPDADAKYCSGPRPVTRACAACAAQWLCTTGAGVTDNPIVCGASSCSCQTGVVSTIGGTPHCYIDGAAGSREDCASASPRPSEPGADIPCAPKTCPIMCRTQPTADPPSQLVACSGANDSLFGVCPAPNQCGTAVNPATVVCTDGTGAAAPNGSDWCDDAPQPAAEDTGPTCSLYTGCGVWQCRPTVPGTDGAPSTLGDPEECKLECSAGCGDGKENFVNGQPICVKWSPGSDGAPDTFEVKTNQDAFCPVTNTASVKPVDAGNCTNHDECSLRCVSPDAASTTVPQVCDSAELSQFGPCAATNQCGDGQATTAFVCFDERAQERTKTSEDCGTGGVSPPIEPTQDCQVYTGCGAWKCATEPPEGDDGSFVPALATCALDCPVGCGTTVQVFTNGSPVCVHPDGTTVLTEEADVAAFCPAKNTDGVKPVLKTCSDHEFCARYCTLPDATDPTKEAPGAEPVPCADPDQSAWLPCNAANACGSGTLETLVVCYDTKFSVRRDNGDCAAEPDQPSNVPCSVYTGCGAYRCRTSAGVLDECVASCPAGCGPSTQVFNGDVTCARLASADGAWVDASASEFCPLENGVPPAEKQCLSTSSCAWQCQLLNDLGAPDPTTMGECTDTKWPTCSTTCGFGSRSRAVDCYAPATADTPTSTVSDAYCTASAPEKTSSCEAFSTCSFGWRCADKDGAEYGSCDNNAGFSICSVDCGAGEQERKVACFDQLDNLRDDKYCTANKPLALQACQGTTCTYVWGCFTGTPQMGSCSGESAVWGACSATCGTGSRTRSAACFTSGGIVLPDTASCTGLVEPVTREDNCASYSGCKWAYSDWTECPCRSSGSAPAPTRSRTATCTDAAGAIASNDFCNNGAAGTAVTTETCLDAYTCSALETPLWYADTTEAAWTSCVGVCGQCVQTRPVTCRLASVATGAATEADGVLADSFCALLPKPSISRVSPTAMTCNAPGVTFSTGTCTLVPATQADGTTPVGDGSLMGACMCSNGYSGTSCTVAPSLSSVVVKAVSGTLIAPGVRVTVTWLFSGVDGQQVWVTLRPTVSLTTPIPTTVVKGVLALSGTVTTTIPDSLAPGTYTFRVHISDNVFGSSAAVAMQSKCATVASLCGAHGSCVAETGACVCRDGYTGAQCATSPCDAAQCNVVGTASCTEATGTCVCASGYVQGSYRCLTPDACELSAPACVNGGIAIAGVSTGCADSCRCFGSFTGTLCATCSLTCVNGIANNACSSCECSPGYMVGTKSTCACRFATLRLAFPLAAIPGVTTDAALAVQWTAALERDLNLLLDPEGTLAMLTTVTSSAAVLTNGTDFVMYTLRVRTWCDPSYEPILTSLAEDADATRGGAFASLATGGDWRLYSAYQRLNTLKEAVEARSLPTDSPLGRMSYAAGVGLSDEACTDGGAACPTSLGAGGVLVADPVVEPEKPVEEDSSSGLSSSGKLIVILCVVLGTLALVGLIVLVAKCMGLCCFKQLVRPTRRLSYNIGGYGNASGSTGVEMGNMYGTRTSSKGKRKPATSWSPRDQDAPRMPWNI